MRIDVGGKTKMKSFLKKLVKLSLGWAGMMVLGAVFQAGGGPQPQQWAGEADTGRTGPVLLLAQQSESDRPKTATPLPSIPQKNRDAKPSRQAPAAPQMERDGSKAGAIGSEPERAGTGKMGGQVIRNKDE
jgi:hypothetical protein